MGMCIPALVLRLSWNVPLFLETRNFPAYTYKVKPYCKSKPHPKTIKYSWQDRVLRYICFCPSKDNTVYNDKRDYTPRALFKSCRNACKSSCIIVTNDATTTIKAGIRTLSGITLRSNDFETTDKVKLYVMGSADGFDKTMMEKVKVKITSKPYGNQKKLTAKLGSDKKTVTIAAAKKVPAGTSVYYLIFYNNKENKGYKIIKITSK